MFKQIASRASVWPNAGNNLTRDARSCSRLLCARIGGLFLALILFVLGATCADAQPSRPLLFVPGILGSRLVDESGAVIWGGRSSYLNFAKLEMTPSGPVTPLHADGRLVESINVLGPFWTIHQYD